MIKVALEAGVVELPPTQKVAETELECSVGMNVIR